MQITVKGKHMDVTDALRSYAEEKVSKVSRYLDNLVSADVTMTVERNWHIVLINIIGEGFDIHGEERTKDMYQSIDRATSKLERQAKRQKAKSSDYRDRERLGQALPEYVPVTSAPVKEEEEMSMAEQLDKYAPKMEVVSSFLAEELSIEEAIKELESRSFDFLAFYNAEKERINIVYKLEKGYGLLDPKVQ